MNKANGKPRRASVSALKVAELAGVSRSAVSRTFTDGASVSPATRAKVLAAAERLGYHVNHLARGLSHHRSGIVCLIVAELQAPFQAVLLEVLTRQLQARGKVVMVLNTAGLARNVEAALKQALNYRAEATVVISGAPPRSLVETCIQNGQRVILINRDDLGPGPQVVMTGNEEAAGKASAILIEAGCQRLAVVSSTAGTPSISGREQAFVAAACAAGYKAEVVRCGPTGYATGQESARQLLSGANPPDGVFCVTDLTALGFLDAARTEMGVSVPGDVSVVGFDDITAAGWSSYALTTFRHPLEEMAEHIATLIEEDEGDSPPQTRRFAAELVWRETVRPRKAP